MSTWSIVSIIFIYALSGNLASAQTTQCTSTAVAGGTANVLTIPPLPCGVTTTLLILTTPTANTSTTVTLQMQGALAQPVVNADGSLLSISQLAAGGITLLTNTGTQWRTFVPPPGGEAINQLTGDVTAGPGVGSQAATLSNNDTARHHLGVGAADTPQFAGVGLNGLVSGTLTVKSAGIAGTNTLTLPAGTTDFSATGGFNQIVKQNSAGGPFTVGQLSGTITQDLVANFGAVCDGTTDDAAAFAAATTWISTANNRLVTIPAKVCATSASIVLGDGWQQSTTLGGSASGTSISITTCSPGGRTIVNGDAIAIKRDDGTTFSGVTAVSCTGTTLVISGAYSGGSASSGKVVFVGHISTYNGGGFIGYGGCTPNGTATPINVSQIKYIGTASPTTTLGALAASGDVSLTVASISNINIGDVIGITLNDASVFWTWVTATPTGTTVKIGNEIPASGAANGATVKLEGNPVAKINGPISDIKFDNICLHGNSTQVVGLDSRHTDRAEIKLVSAVRYTGIGAYIHSSEFYAGAQEGTGDNEYELHAFLPVSAKTIGCWVRGTPAQGVAMSRNRFYGGTCTAGGNDLRSAGLLMEYADNNTFYKPYTALAGNGFTAGTGLYRQPSLNVSRFPSENVYLGAAFIGGVTDGIATGGSLGAETAPAYSIYDSEPVPISATFSGYTSVGLAFGNSVAKDYFSGLKLIKLSATQVSITSGNVASSASTTMLSLPTTCTASLNTSGLDGIDVGSKAASTWYAVFLIGNFGDGTPACILTATTAAAVPAGPTLPAGFTYSAYVGRFKTDVSSNIDSLRLLPRGQFLIDASDTYTPGSSGFRPTSVRLLACGGGASGGSGGRQVSGTAVSGGVGGSGGGCMDTVYPYDQLAARSPISVTVGSGGAAVTAAGSDNTAGTAGNSGNPTFFGASATTAIAYGGAGCAGDGGRLNAAAATGGAGAGTVNSSNAYQLCTVGAAGVGGVSQIGGPFGTASGTTPTDHATSGLGNTGGSSSLSAAANGGNTGGRFSGPGGGAGGGVTAVPAAINGGNGGFSGDGGVGRGTGGTTGAHDGTAGSTSTFAPYFPGGGGGGGYGNSAGNSGDGGAGGPAAGGGGGASTLNGSVAGNSGGGGNGFAYVWEQL